MKRFGKPVLSLIAPVAVFLAMTSPANAAGILFGVPFVSARVSLTVTTTPGPPPVTTTTFTVVLDPPVFEFVDVTVGYDTSLFTFIDGGPLCDFGVGASCPTVVNQTGTGPIPVNSSPIVYGTPLPGSTYSLTSVAGTVNLLYDLTTATNPPAAGADGNFFVMNFQANGPVGSLVTHHGVPGTYDITVGPVTCTTDIGPCITNNPGYGFTFVPEPSTWVLFGGSLIFLARRISRRDKRIQ